MIAVYTTLLSIFVAIILVPLLARVAAPLGLLDRPGPRKIHSNAVPRVGGIAIALGAIISVVIWVPFRPEVVGFACGSMIIFLFGLLDDLLDLDYRIKLIGQLVGATVFVLLSDIHLTRMPFVFDGQLADWLGLPFTLFVIVGITNAVNMSDGMDGLAGGISMLTACALGSLAYLGGDTQIALLTLAVIGATLGFLRYNTHPARVFMGDAGSQFLGFSVVALSLLVIEKCNTAISPLVPLLLLALPIIDTLQVIILRLQAGVSPFSPDRRHLHHRLLDAGLNQYQAVAVIYGLQIILIALTWALLYELDVILLLVFIGFALAVQVLIYWWHRRHQSGKSLIVTSSKMDQFIVYLRESFILSRIGSYGVVLTVSLLFISLALGVDQVNRDISILSLVMLAVSALALFPYSSLPTLAMDRLASFVCVVMLMYLLSDKGLHFDLSPVLLNAYLILIAVLISVWLRFGDSREFRLNTLDVLVIFIVLAAPNMQIVKEAGLGLLILKSLLLFYACEMILSERPRYWLQFRQAVFVTLAILVFRGFFLAA